MKIKSLSHAAIVVSDFKKAVQFYEDIFGFPLVFADDMKDELANTLYELTEVKVRFGLIRIPKGGFIELFQYSDTIREKFAWNRIGQQHFALDVDDVSGWYKKLVQKNIKVVVPPQKYKGAEFLYMEDLDGNTIELIDTGYNYLLNRLAGGVVGQKLMRKKYSNYL